MADITSFFDFHVLPERLADAQAVVADTLIGTRAFPGCLGVDVIVDTSDPTHLVLVERWDSPESDTAYHAWRATPEGRSSLREILDGAPTITQYTAFDA